MSDEKPSLSPRKEKSPQSESSEVRDEKLQALLEKLNLQLEGEPGSPSVDGGKRVHNFWSTQPVPQKPDSVVKKDSPIHPDLPFDEIRKEPIDLPNGMHWCAVDVNSDEEIMELYNLLTENYVEDVDSMFRFDYSSEFLHWALKPPGWRKEWHVGIRYNETGRLIAFISAIPLKLKVRETTKQMVEINFLCVLKNLRKIGLSPTLIKEVTRRVNLTGTFQAVYTAGIKIPTP
ncbi:glycylpeptide N-tetradecanoyltransferase, partial [Spiromyces aspiralis]